MRSMVMVVLGSRRTRWFGYCSYPNERCTSERCEYSGRPGREPASTKFTTTVSTMGSEVNRFSIIDSASMPTYKLPTHWYVDPVGSNSNSVFFNTGFTLFTETRRWRNIERFLRNITSGTLLSTGTKWPNRRMRYSCP